MSALEANVGIGRLVGAAQGVGVEGVTGGLRG